MLNISKNRVQDELLKSYHIKSLSNLQSPTIRNGVIWWLRGLLLLLIIVLFLPWQQNISGKGYVTALNPESRPQNIQNAVAGQIREWRVGEGDFVKKGDTLFIISEVKDDYFDPQILTRTNEQIKAKQDGIVAYQAKVSASGGQIVALRQGLDYSLQKTRNKLQQAQMKVRADSADLLAANKNNQITLDRLRRGEEMYREGVISLTDLESRRLKAQEDGQKQISTEQKLLISRNELINARIELNSVTVEYQKDIAKAESDRSSGQSSLAEGQGELSKLQNKFENIRLRRNQYVVCAPQDGYIVKTLKAGIGETIKEGESVITLQPNDPKLAIELYIDATDLPLVAINRPARLEFDGWPALQFSGWPGASVGTFGGQVAVIDRITSKNGQYRILVKPDKNELAWPEQIRIGSAVQGIIMLEDVPVWWEIWRQLNAFPPNFIDDKTEDKKEK
jgi:membrane fusion protein, adhesin transport system